MVIQVLSLRSTQESLAKQVITPKRTDKGLALVLGSLENSSRRDLQKEILPHW